MIIETDLPARFKYWNVQINDALRNQVELGYRQSSLNGLQARLDADGKAGPGGSGVPNWLNSGDHVRGMLVGRWHGAGSYPMPTIRKHLPVDTPRAMTWEREAVLRQRNLGLQMRQRW